MKTHMLRVHTASSTSDLLTTRPKHTSSLTVQLSTTQEVHRKPSGKHAREWFSSINSSSQASSSHFHGSRLKVSRKMQCAKQAFVLQLPVRWWQPRVQVLNNACGACILWPELRLRVFSYQQQCSRTVRPSCGKPLLLSYDSRASSWLHLTWMMRVWMASKSSQQKQT